MQRAIKLFVLGLVFFFHLYGLCFSEDAKIVINARSIKRLPSLNLVIAKGGVEIKYKGVRLTADEVRLNVKTKDLIAVGNVTIWEKDSYMKCDRLEFNLDTKQGIAYRARGYFSPYYYFKGEKIKRLSDSVYNIYKGEVTTCESCEGKEPDWKFKGRRIIINTRSFTRVYGASGWIKKIPVIYAPYLLIPVRKERKTGFLIPKVGYKSGLGTFVRVPFYWAISESQDATFWATPYSDGSLKVAAEYRQKFSKDEFLYTRGNYLEEKSKKSNRWSFKLDAFKRLPYETELTAKADITSTTKYKKEFSEDFESYTKRFNDSYLLLVRRFANARFSVLGRFKDDLEYGYEQRTDRIPEVNFDFYSTRVKHTPFYIEGKAQFLKYRDKNDTEGYDYKVSRIDLFPKISLPFEPWPWFSITPKYGLRYTAWSKHLDRKSGMDPGWISRTIYTFETYVKGPLLYKNFTLLGRKLRHDVIPEVRYLYIPDERKDQEDIYRFDDVDVMDPVNKVTYSITNRFFTLGEHPREVMKIRLEQSWDILRDRRSLPKKFSDIMFEVDLNPAPNFSLQSRVYQGVYGEGVTRWNVSTFFSKPLLKGELIPSMRLTYYYVKGTQERFIRYEPALRFKNVSVRLSYKRDLYYDYWVDRSWFVRIEKKCWSIDIGYRSVDNRYNGARNDKMITFLITLRGIGSFGKR